MWYKKCLSSQLLDSSNQKKFVNAMRENHFVRLYAALLYQYYKEFCYSPLNSYSHDVWLYQLRHRSHLCLRALKRKYIWSNLHFIVDEKVKILHFHDEDKSWWSSILYQTVANANRHLYILVLITPQLVIDCFEL